MIKKYAADSIASEMFKLLRKTAMEEAHEDDAKDQSKKMKMEDDAKDMHHEKSHKMEDDAMDEMADYLAEEDEVEDDAFDNLDDEIQSMHDHAEDEENDSSDNLMLQNEMLSEASDKNVILMKGLGKIEAGLRRKGESFAADLVRATAFDIQNDIIKEAEQKEYVLRNLIKMASSLEARGESLAADICRVTINKINR